MSSKPKKTPPAKTPQQRENQMIALSMDLAEEQLRTGVATSQVVTHFLKLATLKEQLEREKLQKENELLRAKTDSLSSGQRLEELVDGAMRALRGYRGETHEYDD